MPEAGDRIRVPVSQEEAWDFAADARNAARWVFGVREVSGALRHPLLPGDRLRIRLVAGGRMADSEWQVDRCERPTLLTSSGRAFGATATLRIECLPLSPTSSEVRYSLVYRLPGGALGVLAARFGIQGILEVQAKQSVRALRRLLAASARARSWRPSALEPGDLPSR
ncbi:MAG: SRPBCC family protein [Candidatus Dormiibacterota bacterium]